MTNIIEYRAEIKSISVLERINKKEPVYLCINEDNEAMFGTPIYSAAMQYSRLNKCSVSYYPIGCYCEQ